MVESGVLLHRRLREKRSRRAVETQALPRAFPNGQRRDVLALQLDLASRRRDESRNGFK